MSTSMEQLAVAKYVPVTDEGGRKQVQDGRGWSSDFRGGNVKECPVHRLAAGWRAGALVANLILLFKVKDAVLCPVPIDACFQMCHNYLLSILS